MMRKIISILLALMLFGSMTVTAMAGSFQLSPNRKQIDAGEKVTVTIKLDTTLKGNYRNVQGQLSYNPDELTYVSHTMGESYGDYTAKNMTAKEYFTFSYTDFSKGGFTTIAKGTVAAVTFKAKESLSVSHLTSALTLNMSVQDIKGNSSKSSADVSVVICKNHTWGKGVVTTPATCTKKGVTTYTCTYKGCGATKSESNLSKLKHDMKAATCTKAAKCKNCDYTEGKALGHKVKTITGRAATCTKTGLTNGKKCTVCGTVTVKQQTIKAKGHSYSDTYTVDKAASLTKNGSKSRHCSRCDAKTGTKTIYKLATTKLGTKTYTYNGKVRSPKVILKDSKGNTIASKNYTVTKAKGRKNVGTYTYKVTFKNEYKGIKAKSFTFKINPKATKITSLTKGKKSFTVKWSKKTTQTTGYQVYYSASKKRTGGKQITISKNSTTKKTISKLKSGKIYYVWVRTYKTVDGKKYYSTWSERKSVKTR